MKNTFENIPPISRSEAERAFESNQTSDVVRALISLALNDPDWRWVQDKCLPFLRHDDRWIRGAAAISLGHLARIHRHLDVSVVKPELQRLTTDPEMDGKAQDALDDIETYLEGSQ